MNKILFLIHDLGPGGAEKVLVNLVNNMDKSKFDITLMSLFDEGINKQFIDSSVKYKSVFGKSFPGNSRVMKLLSPEKLHRLFIKEKYDIEVAYLEGPCARIISGCEDRNIKTVCWIHCSMPDEKSASSGFRNFQETKKCYNAFDEVACVSESVASMFKSFLSGKKISVLHNVLESNKILNMSKKSIDFAFDTECINICAVGKITKNKGFDRLARIHKKLADKGYKIHFYILGTGEDENEIKDYCKKNNTELSFIFLGYQTNPYKYVSKCDLFICSSYAEGFSTAATEALIVGTPVLTTRVAGMSEMLGENKYGMIVDNDEISLYNGLKDLLDNPDKLLHYKKMAEIRGRAFSTAKTVAAVEKMLLDL